MAPRFCLDHLSLVDLDAEQLIAIAADAGFAAVSLFVTPIPISAAADLVADATRRKAVTRSLAATGLGVGIVEPFMLDAAPDWACLQRSAALAAALGGTVNILGMDDEAARLQDGMARMVGIARSEGAPVTIEAYPASTVRTQAQALQLAEALGPDVGLCIDSLHVIRSGGTWADVAALPPERIRHVQLNDGPLEAPADRTDEAVFGRAPPGEGAFDLPALLPLLPAHATIAVEAPSRALAELPARARAARLMAVMRLLFDRIPA
ncbi:MAG: TIM barrel protein [Novosphingobium sp.]